MKKLIVILSVALLSGCYQRIDFADIKLAQEWCAKQDNSTVLYIDSTATGLEQVTCTNKAFSGNIGNTPANTRN